MRIAILVGLAGCAAPARFDKPRAAMTRRERDSTVAASGLPGSGVVKKAMSMTDAENRRAAAVDSASREN